MKKNNIYTDHTLIINELEKSIKIYNWDFILSFTMDTCMYGLSALKLGTSQM